MYSGACGGVSRALEQWFTEGGGGGEGRGSKNTIFDFLKFQHFFRRKSMIFQDELGSGGPAYESWGRMVEEHALRAEVENNAVATCPTCRKRFVIDNNQLRKRMHRGNCVVRSLRGSFLSLALGIFGEIPNLTPWGGSSLQVPPGWPRSGFGDLIDPHQGVSNVRSQIFGSNFS